MPSQPIKCLIQMPDGQPCQFDILAHLSPSSDQRLIDQGFYEKWCQPGRVPQGPHYELEVLGPKVWELPHHRAIHFHRVPDSEHKFVCWTGPLPTIEDVFEVLKTWCVGTAYTVQSGTSFSQLHSENPLTFLDRMEQQGIRLLSIE